MANACQRRVLTAIRAVEGAVNGRRCDVAAARRLEKAMHDCHRSYLPEFERRANRALTRFEGRCGTLSWKNLGGARRRRKRRR